MEHQSNSQIKFRLIKGWLDILVSIQQPKTQTASYCMLNADGMAMLFSNLA